MFYIKAIFSRKMFRFNIIPEAIVGPLIMLGARWVVLSLADFITVMIYYKSVLRIGLYIHKKHRQMMDDNRW